MLLDRLTILIAAVIFAGIAWFFPHLGPILQRRRIRPPHHVMTLVFRLWFAALAVATVALLFFSKPHPR